jgi:predicted alpha/beta hydrolase family esterase
VTVPYFVGHSIGCQTILRYIEQLPTEVKVAGVILVAPWMTLMNQSPEEVEIAGPWIETSIDFEKVKTHTQKFVTIFSDDDPCVPIENKNLFEERLGAETILEHNKGHFSGSDGITQLPSVFRALMSLASSV